MESKAAHLEGTSYGTPYLSLKSLCSCTGRLCGLFL